MVVVLCAPIGHLRASDDAPVAVAVASVGMTVSDMDRSIDFYSKVLTFEKISDAEVWGNEYEQLQGVFGLRMRVVRMRLGKEFIELTEYLAPQGRPIPVDSRSHDRWFQHVAIIVSDMDGAYQWLRRFKVQHASSGPQRLPDWNPNAGGIQAFYFKDPDGHSLEILQFPPGKGDPKWQRIISPAHPRGAETPLAPSSPAHPEALFHPPTPSLPKQALSTGTAPLPGGNRLFLG
ncbi:MAG: VOC family protein, partial [Nitrospiraceae bacterium]